jgi:hypothetical protein
MISIYLAGIMCEVTIRIGYLRLVELFSLPLDALDLQIKKIARIHAYLSFRDYQIFPHLIII